MPGRSWAARLSARVPFPLTVAAALAVLAAACTPRPTATMAPLPAADASAPAGDAADAIERTTRVETIRVFAAASLDRAFREIATAFEAAHPDVKVEFDFAGSPTLATQIVEGADADVFASANQRQMDVVVAAGAVVRGTDRPFARNRLVVVTPADNAGGIVTLADLAKPGVQLAFAHKGVPVGDYALQFLDKASAAPGFTAAYSPTVLANVVTFEDEVRGVLTKVVLGEVDGGIVYTSDIARDTAAPLGRVEIPDALNVIATYPIAPLARSTHPEAAQAFIDFVRGAEGKGVLVGFGFLGVERVEGGPMP